MKEILMSKLDELGQEAKELVSQREKLFNMIQELEVRLHQISGAISEIDKIIKAL